MLTLSMLSRETVVEMDQNHQNLHQYQRALHHPYAKPTAGGGVRGPGGLDLGPQRPLTSEQVWVLQQPSC